MSQAFSSRSCCLPFYDHSILLSSTTTFSGAASKGALRSRAFRVLNNSSVLYISIWTSEHLHEADDSAFYFHSELFTKRTNPFPTKSAAQKRRRKQENSILQKAFAPGSEAALIFGCRTSRLFSQTPFGRNRYRRLDFRPSFFIGGCCRRSIMEPKWNMLCCCC